jgi:DNA recombination protein RmuC
MGSTILAVAILALALGLLLQGILLWRARRIDPGFLQGALQPLERSLERLERAGREEASKGRAESSAMAQAAREELGASLQRFNDSVLYTLTCLSEAQKKEVETLTAQIAAQTESGQVRLEALKTAVEARLAAIQEQNGMKLEEMRQTVDEKLQATLERRLGESFRAVGNQLEQVHKGLGEMQALAAGVGDLRKVLTNVKTRGTWGEVQLWALLDQALAPDQYEANLAPRDGGERVEFAVRLPGRGDGPEDAVWLPIDSKYPTESFQRLLEAEERGDAAAVEEAGRELEAAIKRCAKDISDKYLNPPRTTDFAILFLPTEGLFAEVLRRPELADYIQTRCRVVAAGPTTLWSLLNSLQMGFRTLAIQKRSSEVWNLLAAVKTEWAKSGDLLAKVQKKLQEASNTMSQVATRNRAIGRRLVDVQTLPALEAQARLQLGPAPGEAEPDAEGEPTA